MLRSIIVKTFDTYIVDTIKNNDVCSYLLKHPRKSKCIDNITKEIKILELRRKVDLITITNLVKDLANIFCKTALESKRQELLSLTAKIVESRKFDEQAKQEKIDVSNRHKPITLDLSDLD